MPVVNAQKKAGKKVQFSTGFFQASLVQNFIYDKREDYILTSNSGKLFKLYWREYTFI